jgi:hypothetical protein
MKKGNLVKINESLLDPNGQIKKYVYDEVIDFNRRISFIWAFATNRRVMPPVQSIQLPRLTAGLLLDDSCDDFKMWVIMTRDDPRNSIKDTLVRILWDGQVIVTKKKWIQFVYQNVEKKHCGEL